MPLSTGDKRGPYEVLAPIGAPQKADALLEQIAAGKYESTSSCPID